MKIRVTSFVPGKQHLTDVYELNGNPKLADFLRTLEIKWDFDALVMVNNSLVNQDYSLKDDDEIFLLVPIVGG